MSQDTAFWLTVRHFTREEWPRDPDRILPAVVHLADQMREDSGWPIVVHVAWDDAGHVGDSTHYTDRTEFATGFDFHFAGVPLVEQWLFAERYPWRGLGVYPYWNTPGLHCDLRTLGREHPNLGHRWWRDREGKYHPFSRELLRVLTA